MTFRRTTFTCFLLLFSTILYSQPKKTDTWLKQGHSFSENLEYQNAINAFQKSWERNENVEALWGLALATFERGNQYQFNGRSQNAQNKYNEALSLAESLVSIDISNPDYALFLGLMYLYNQRTESAVLQFETVNTNYPSNGRAYYYIWTQLTLDATAKVEHPYIKKALTLDPDLFEFYQELGAYYTSLNQADKAIASYEKALTISPINYKTHFALGQVYWALGNLEKMRYHFEQSLIYFPDFGYAEMLLAGVELMSNNLPEALPLIRSALKHNPATEQYLTMYTQNYPELASYNFKESSSDALIDAQGYPVHYTQAVSLAQAFDFYGAIKLLHQSYDSYTQYDQASPAWETSILAWLTHCQRELGNYGEAAHAGKKALDLAIKNDLTTDQASLAANLSMIYYTWGDFPNSIHYARISLDYLQAHGQLVQLYDAYINLGGYYRKWEQADSAVYFHKKALHEVSDRSSLRYVIAQKELALSYIALNHPDGARNLLEEMNKIRTQQSFLDQEAALDFGCAQIYYALGDYQVAWDFASKSFAYYAKLEQVSPEHPSLIPFLENYIGLAIKLNRTELAYANYQSLNYKLINQISNYFSAMSENGKLLFYRDIKKHFQSFNSFAISHTDLNQDILHQLYENQLLVKGLLFNDAIKIQQTVSNSEDKSLKKTHQKLLQKKNLLARSVTLTSDEKTSRGIDTGVIQSKIDSLQVQLIRLGMNPMSHSVYEPELVQKVTDQLAPNEAAIEIIRFLTYDYSNGGFFAEKVNYLALILKGNTSDIEYVHLKNGNELESKGYQAYTNAIEYELKDIESYPVFWSSIAKKLKGINRVYFAGDGIYHKINLNTLQNPQNSKFLLETLDLRLVTSTRDLLKTDVPLPSRGKVFLIGFPTYTISSNLPTTANSHKPVAMRAFTNIENLDPLPGTYSEVTMIESILNKSKWKTNVLTGEDALEERIKELTNPTILHIATHGYFVESSPKDNPLFYSGLFLTGASSNYKNKTKYGEDGILTAYEAMGLTLNETQMVVLSACETGMGRVENGEGVYGLQRAFLIAGSKSVVMSLWKVNDQTTMELMTEFYQNLNNSIDKHTSFRNAQLDLKKKHPNPKYWGAFNIIGR